MTIDYDPSLFSVERRAAGVWVAVPSASVTWSSDYNLYDNTGGTPPSPISTLVVGTESATISLSRWGATGADILYPTDRVRVRYDGKVLFIGFVESVTITFTADPAAQYYGEDRRTDIEATVAGYYISLLSRTVTWPALPPATTTWDTFIRRYVAVD